MPIVRAFGPVVMTCVLFLAFASGCGENGGHLSSSRALGVGRGGGGEDAIPATYRPATAITSLDQVADAVAVADLGANEVVTFEHFGLPTDTALGPLRLGRVNP